MKRSIKNVQQSNKLYKTGMRTNKINLPRKPSRGGIRL